MYPPPHPSQPQISHSYVPPSQQYQSHMDHQTSSIPQIAYHSPQASTQPMIEIPQMDLGLDVPVFSQGDDPFACLNKAMDFLTTVASSRRGKDKVILVLAIRVMLLVSKRNNTSGQARVVKCYNYQGEGHMSRQRTQPKRPRNAAWFKDKAMLAEAEEAGQILDEEQLAFLIDLGIPDGQAAQTTISNNATFQNEDLDAYDSDCDDVSNAKAVLMANIFNYGSDVISEVPHSDSYHNDMNNQSVHAMQYFKQTPVVDFFNNEIHSDSNIISTNDNHVNHWEKANQEKNNELVTAELERYKERVKTFEQRLNIDLSSRKKMNDSQMDDMIKENLALKELVDSLEQNLSKQIKENESLLQTFTVFKNESREKESNYMENEIDLEKKIKELDNIVYKVGQSAQTVHMLTKAQVFYDNAHKQALGYQNPFYLKKAQRIKPTLYDGSVISSKHVAMLVIDDDETLILEEVSRSKMLAKQNDPISKEKKVNTTPINHVELNKLSEDFGKRFVPQQELSAEQAFWFHMSNPITESSDASPVKVEAPSKLPKVSLVNESLKKLKFHLSKFDSVVKIRTTPDALTKGEWGFELTKTVFINEIIPFLKSLKDIFNVFDKDILNEITEVQTVFNQMEAAVQQCSVYTQCFEIVNIEHFLENDRLLQKIMSQDVLLSIMNSITLNGESVNVVMQRTESCDKCFNLDAELLKTQNAYNDLLKSYSQLEKHCISLEFSIQLNQEIFQKDKSCDNQNALEILEYFENNDLKVQLQDKETTNCQLKEIIKSMRENNNEEKVNHDISELETINEELENSVAKFLFENEHLCKEINHVKQVFKDKFDSIKKIRVRTKEQSDSLIAKLNIKSVKNEDLKAQIQDKVVQIVLWYLDSGCSKHMIGNRSQLMNFVSKFLGTVRFWNNQIAKIMGYGDYQLGNVIISRVYYVEGLGHNLFSVGQFCDADLEVAFRKNTCFIRNLEGVDLLSRSRDTNLYTISLDDMLKTSSIYLLSKASKTKSWLWNRLLSHLNFGTLNKLAKDGLDRGILKFKFKKDHLCSACALGKSKKSSHQLKAEDTNQEKLYLLHMDLCGPMRMESINGKKYILVIVDDYSRFTWVKFLRSKDEAPEAIIKCIKNIHVRLNATARNVRTNNETEFVNQTLRDFYENVSISHQTFVARSP
ncbi:retrovirus-related pol polyprotein from transposon TNT 1-94 [Tanacetum coccineum]|uniref:Retrovirus-related pol polyprotein from transposon TNT 1-94 n=1 Tax=Tanacetum coccineum TaxID=301880 RepID=A0ABQ5AKZ0_9ASTR